MVTVVLIPILLMVILNGKWRSGSNGMEASAEISTSMEAMEDLNSGPLS